MVPTNRHQKLVRSLLKFQAFVADMDTLTGVSFDHITFSDSNGLLWQQEVYKREAFASAREALACGTWTEGDIGTGWIAECVKAAVAKDFNFKDELSYVKVNNAHQDEARLPATERIFLGLYTVDKNAPSRT